MSIPYLGEMRIFGFGFAPKGWANCSGQILSIAQNTALFSLLGTTYGGNGVTTFALPDLRGRVPIHFNSSYPLGAAAGTTAVTLLPTELAAHTHPLVATSVVATLPAPSGNLIAQTPSAVGNAYSGASPPFDTALNAAMIGSTGGNQPHENMQPYLVLNICIALLGVFPSRN